MFELPGDALRPQAFLDLRTRALPDTSGAPGFDPPPDELRCVR